MLLCLIKKMGKSKWLFLCLIMGVVFTTSIVTSIPMYTKYMLNSILQTKFTDFKEDNKFDAGLVNIKGNFDKDRSVKHYQINEIYLKNIKNKIDSLKTGYKREDMLIKTNPLYRVSQDGVKYNDINTWDSLYLSCLNGLNKSVTLSEGKFPEKTQNKDYYEAMILSDDFISYCFKLNSIYTFTSDSNGKGKEVKIKIVGTYKKDNSVNSNATDIGGLILDKDTFLNNMLKNESNIRIANVTISYLLNINKVTTSNLSSFEEKGKDLTRTVKSWDGFDIVFNASSPISEYKKVENQFNIIMYMFYTPVLIMLLFYISMMSGLIIENDSDEISVMRSRGASTFQIFKEYIYESIIVCAFGILLGPLGGKLLCLIFGSASGFMKFSGFSKINIPVDKGMYIYTLLIALIFFITLLVPAALNLKKSIVVKKQQGSARQGKPFYIKYYVDIILLLISFYGIYLYKVKKGNVFGGSSKYNSLDPVLYIVSAAFFIGLSMFFIRIYPYIIKLIFKISKKFLSNSLYYAFINTERGGKGLFLIMLFVLITASLCIFDMKIANTLNEITVNRTKYLVGSDITIVSDWNSSDDDKGIDERPVKIAGSENNYSENLVYYEPPFSEFQNIKGIESVTKVLRQVNGEAKFGSNEAKSVYVMGIIPHEFGKTAYFNPKYLKTHWFNYLNILTKEKNSVIISKSLADSFGIGIGDVVYYKWDKTLYLEGKVGGIVEYFPTYDTTNKNEENGSSSEYMIVGNLNFMQESMLTTPYEVWMKKSPNASNDTIYSTLAKRSVQVRSFKDLGNELKKEKSQPVIKATNESLTLGFTAAMLISAMGIIIYAILSLRKRLLIFGILRSTGMASSEVFKMILYESLLSFGIACVVGISIGQLTSSIFVPMIMSVWNTGKLSLPNTSFSLFSDYMRLTVLVIIIFLIISVNIYKFIKKLKISEAVKLGED